MSDTNHSVSIILPALNEAESIAEVLKDIQQQDGAEEWELIVVDDGSYDNTAVVAEKVGAIVVRHEYNLGNGASVKSGAAAASGDILVFLDSDGQHPPKDISKLLEHLPAYDMAVGSRVKESNVSKFRSIGNSILIKFAELLSGHKIMDLTSGFRAVKATRFKEFSHLYPQRYSYPTTITLSLFSAGYFIKYVPLPDIKKRDTGTSNIKPFRDGFRFLNIIMRIIILFHPMKVFLPVSLFFFTLGALKAIIDAVMHFRLEEGTLFLLISSLFIFFFGVLADQIAHIRRELHSLRSEKVD